MKVSLNWLKDYVDIRMEVKELVDLLTMAVWRWRSHFHG